MMNERLIFNVTSDIVLDDESRAVDGLRRISAGERLSEDWFPKKIWFNKNSKLKIAMPDFFDGNGYYIVSKSCVEVLKAFDVGDATFYPVCVLQKDQVTRVEGDFYTMNICNRKQAFIGAESPETRPFLSNEERALGFVQKDGDVAVSKHALEGPDIWVDTKLHRAFFVSDKLAQAMKEAGISRSFGLRRCRVL